MQLEILKENYLEYVLVNFKKGTYDCYKNHLDYTIKYFKFNCNIIDSDNITNKDIYQFIMYQKNNEVSNSTINKRIGPFKRMLKFNGKLTDELSKIAKLRENKVNFSYLSARDISILNEYLDQDCISLKSKLIISLLLDTGIRLGELLKLKACNFNIVDSYIYLNQTKTNCDRIVFFTERTKHLLELVKLDNFLETVTYSSIRSLCVRIKKQCNFKKFHPHMLRHTFATILIDHNVNLIAIRDLLGHVDVKTTERYIHADNRKYQSLYNQFMKY